MKSFRLLLIGFGSLTATVLTALLYESPAAVSRQRAAQAALPALDETWRPVADFSEVPPALANSLDSRYAFLGR